MQVITRAPERRQIAFRDGSGDVVRDRCREGSYGVLPDQLTLVAELEFLADVEARQFSQVQGGAYAQLREGFEATISAAVFHSAPREQTYTGVLACALAGKSRWAVLALNCHFGLFAHAHAWHDEYEWRGEDARITLRQKDRAVEEFVTLLLAVDRALQAQAGADTCRFLAACGEARFTPWQQVRVGAQMLRAYRWQHLVRGLRHPDFQSLLQELTTPLQYSRIEQALRPLSGTFGVAG